MRPDREQGTPAGSEEAATRIAQLTAELQRLRAQQEELASVIGHDLRAPLRAVRMFSQVIEYDCGDALPEQAASSLGHIKAGGAKLETLIDGVVALLRVHQGTAGPERVDLTQMVHQVLEELSEETVAAGAEVSVDVPFDIAAPPGQVRTVVSHLLGNALRFRFPDRIPRVDVSATLKTEGVVELRIRDNGLGIEPDLQAGIFRPFRRLHLPDKYPGAGLGLSICRALVEAWGGHIWVESTPQVGSTFFATFRAWV